MLRSRQQAGGGTFGADSSRPFLMDSDAAGVELLHSQLEAYQHELEQKDTKIAELEDDLAAKVAEYQQQIESQGAVILNMSEATHSLTIEEQANVEELYGLALEKFQSLQYAEAKEIFKDVLRRAPDYETARSVEPGGSTASVGFQWQHADQPGSGLQRVLGDDRRG